MNDRSKGIAGLLAEREHQERVDIQVVMRELEQPEAVQLMLKGFSDDEREQFQVNADALRVRLAQIPGELEREVAAIKLRYANPTPRLFPVAVTFLVPERVG